jgi:hypothetical protein
MGGCETEKLSKNNDFLASDATCVTLNRMTLVGSMLRLTEVRWRILILTLATFAALC